MKRQQRSLINQEGLNFYFAEFKSYGEALGFVNELPLVEVLTAECFQIYEGAVVSIISQNLIESLQSFFMGVVDVSYVQILLGKTGASLAAYCAVCESGSAKDLIGLSIQARQEGFKIVEIRLSKSRPGHHMILTSGEAFQLTPSSKVVVRSFPTKEPLKDFFS